MSTTEIDSWQVDLVEVGPIYPFVGIEMILVIAAIVFWIAFHIVQIVQENRVYREDEANLADPETFRAAQRHSNELED